MSQVQGASLWNADSYQLSTIDIAHEICVLAIGLDLERASWNYKYNRIKDMLSCRLQGGFGDKREG